MQLTIGDPSDQHGWDEYVRRHKDGSVFHSTSWARVIRAAYDYEPCYVALHTDGEIAGILPLFSVKSMLTGTRGVALPFSDYSPPLAAELPSTELLQAAQQIGRVRHWKYLEIRGGSFDVNANHDESYFLLHRVDLSNGVAGCRDRLSAACRRNIAKAQAEGVVVTDSNSLGAVRDYYRLNCLTRKRHGLPCNPWHFFRALHQYIIAEGGGAVSLAILDGKVVAGAIYLHFGGEAIYKYGASDVRYWGARPNNLLLWKGIEHYATNGFSALSLGRSLPQQTGLVRFKKSFGADAARLDYFRYDFASDHLRASVGRHVERESSIASRLPLPLLKCAGRLLYRHMG